MLRRTTSMPTPRPERLLICSAVEKPASKISLWISSSVSVCASGLTRPRSMALARMRCLFSPPPSSLTSMAMLPESW
jgi:hypothetical protein